MRTRLMRRNEMEGMSPSVCSCMRKSGMWSEVGIGVVEWKRIEGDGNEWRMEYID